MGRLIRKHILLGEIRPLDGAHVHFIEISKLISPFLICTKENGQVGAKNKVKHQIFCLHRILLSLNYSSGHKSEFPTMF